MKRIILQWEASKLYKNRSRIQYPDFQREPTVWNDRKKQLLIDSMLIGLDIPKIYLYKPMEGVTDAKSAENDDKGTYDCIDGQQRIISLVEFIEGKFKLEDGRKWGDLKHSEKRDLLNYKFTIALITEATEEDLRLLFLRLQLGAPLNVGEKLHALTGEMRDFVFDVAIKHPFFRKLRIPERRFVKETVFAQICINSFYQSIHGTYYSARYEELKAFFEQYKNLKNYGAEKTRIIQTLDELEKNFGKVAYQFKNRAVIVSGYLFVEDLLNNKENSKLPIFKEFYLQFLDKLYEQSSKGLDYDRGYRELLDFQTNILQAAVGKSAIETRQRILKNYFEYYIKTHRIKKLKNT